MTLEKSPQNVKQINNLCPILGVKWTRSSVPGTILVHLFKPWGNSEYWYFWEIRENQRTMSEPS